MWLPVLIVKSTFVFKSIQLIMKHKLKGCSMLCLTFLMMALVFQGIINNRAMANPGVKVYHITICEDEKKVQEDYYNLFFIKLIGLI